MERLRTALPNDQEATEPEEQKGDALRAAVRELAVPLVLEWLHTRREIIREHESLTAVLETNTGTEIPETSETSEAGLNADAALFEFLGSTYAAEAVLDVLDHHFATDYSEIHGEAPTLTFTSEFDAVLASGGKDACERHEDGQPATS